MAAESHELSLPQAMRESGEREGGRVREREAWRGGEE